MEERVGEVPTLPAAAELFAKASVGCGNAAGSVGCGGSCGCSSLSVDGITSGEWLPFRGGVRGLLLALEALEVESGDVLDTLLMRSAGTRRTWLGDVPSGIDM